MTLQELAPGIDSDVGSQETARVTTRPSIAADSQLMLQLFVDSHGDEMAGFGWTLEDNRTFVILQAQGHEADLVREHPQLDRLTICIDGVPVGRVLVECTDTAFHLIDICLLGAYRNRGFGTTMLLELCEEAGRARLPLLIVVPKANPVTGLLQRLGFGHPEDLGDRWLLSWVPLTS